MKISPTEFRKLSLQERYILLKKEGEHIAAKAQGIHRIHLFGIAGFYVEVWIVISLNQVHWIEVQENKSILAEYASTVDVKKNLGI